MASRIDQQELQRLEGLLLAAAGYVRASDDLRPRSLEAARAALSDRCDRRKVLSVVCGWVLIASTTNLGDGQVAARPVDFVQGGLTVDTEELFRLANTLEESDQAWGLVEAFNELRHRQAEAFRGHQPADSGKAPPRDGAADDASGSP